jgi:predicted PhzF superfamily epimerase YddE/YHI9
VIKVRVVRVFANEQGEFGNPLGLIEGDAVPSPEYRRAIATALGYSEVVFIEDLSTATIRTYGRTREVPFAGHAAVGAAWFISQVTGKSVSVLHTAAGKVRTWIDEDGTWVRASLGGTPGWWHERLASASVVDGLHGPLSASQDMTQLWAWEDEAAGAMRVRTFASRVGVNEDEACGSGAMRLAAALGRRLRLHHGQGSLIHAQPGPPGHAEIGGRVVEDQPREIDG